MIIALGLVAASYLPAEAAPLGRAKLTRSDGTPGLQHADKLRRADPSRQMTVGVNLALRNGPQLEDFIAQVSDRKSPSYGHYLTPDQFAATYGPTQSQVKQVVDELRTSGLSVGSVSSNRTIVQAAGPVSAVEAAFGGTIADWHDRDENRDFFGNDAEPTLPAAIAPYIVGVAGLNNHYPVHRAGLAPRVGGGPSGGYTPNELKKAYDVTPLATAGYNGSGQQLGLFELDGFRQSNITSYDTQYGLASPAPSTVIVNGGPGPLGTGEIEVELDIEVMHAIAPASPITVWEGPNTDPGVNATYNAMVTSDTTKSNSTSWGICEPNTTQAEMTTLDNIFKQAGSQGQSFFAASGDNGAYDCGNNRLTVDSPANDPYVTGAGGTNLALNVDSSYKSESAWSNPNRFPASGSGGGLSSYFARPGWQTGPGVANTYSNGKRQVPDVALDADPQTGYSVYVTYNGSTGWNVVGGTSAAAPGWAAFTGVYDQYAAAQGKPNLGFANPTLYTTGSNAQPYLPYHDITSGDNLYYPATANWDYATGWGTYDAYNFARDLACCPALAYGQSPQGNWNGTRGSDGYALLAWNASTDLVSLPLASLILDQGYRYQWATSSADPRALLSPDATSRRASSWYHPSQLKLRLTFVQSYTGPIYLYAVDWDAKGRREAITVNDGSGPRTANVVTPFDQGAWTSASITVPAGGSLAISIDNKGGDNAVLSGIFLGGGPTVAPPSPSALVASPASPYQVNLRWTGAVSSAEYSIERSRDGVGNWITVGTAAMASYSDTGLGQGTAYYYRVRASNAIGTSNPSSTASATTTTPTLGYTQAPQGNWVGAYGIDGNALLGWNGGADLISWPKGGIAMDQGLRYQWTATTMDSRALQSPDGTTRRAACWYHQTQVSLHLTFRASYSGVLRVYVLDWDSTARQEAITINDGAGPKTAAITTTFNQGAWLSLPINIGADGAVSILIDGLAGDNAVVSGLFLN